MATMLARALVLVQEAATRPRPSLLRLDLATAAGCAALALGTETCGVRGLRPTFGQVARHGAMALSRTMDEAGPIARRATDGAHSGSGGC